MIPNRNPEKALRGGETYRKGGKLWGLLSVLEGKEAEVLTSIISGLAVALALRFME